MHSRSTVSSPHVPWPFHGTLVTGENPRRCFYQNQMIDNNKKNIKEYYSFSRGPSSHPLPSRPQGITDNCFPVNWPLNITAVFFFPPHFPLKLSVTLNITQRMVWSSPNSQRLPPWLWLEIVKKAGIPLKVFLELSLLIPYTCNYGFERELRPSMNEQGMISTLHPPETLYHWSYGWMQVELKQGFLPASPSSLFKRQLFPIDHNLFPLID